MKIDTQTLLARVDLRAVLESELGPADAAGSWRCPFHEDGSPSFGTVPTKPHLWHCFGCGRSGDALAFIRERRGLDFRAACEALSTGRPLPVDPRHASSRPRPAAVRQSVPPAATWADRAAVVAAEAAVALWTPAGREGLEYLRGRGIADGTARAFGLGWIPSDLRDAPAAWGLPEDHKPVWTPAGVCIPWKVDGEHWRLNVRRLNPGDEPKYIGPAGFRPGLFNAAALVPGRPAVLCEGELDAMAVHQAAGDLVAAVATGSTSGARAARWLYALAAAPAVLVAFDADAAGDDAAAWWLAWLPHARRLRPVGAKDPNAMHPERLRTWVVQALGITAPAAGIPPFPQAWRERFSCEQLERLAIRTVDAGLSDAEALAAEGLCLP